jgi:hypothetical protein
VRGLLLQAEPPEKTIIEIMCSWRSPINLKVTSVKRFETTIKRKNPPLPFPV